MEVPNEDYDTMYSVDTYPADIPEEEVEKTVRKALKHKQMDKAIEDAFKKHSDMIDAINQVDGPSGSM